MGIVRYGLDGNVIWYRAYFDNLLNGVIQDSEGNFVVCGQGVNDSQPAAYTAPNDMGTPRPLNVYGGDGTSLGLFSGSAAQPCEPVGGGRGVMFVMKVNPDGDIIWNSYYTPATNLTDARLRSWGYDLVETRKNSTIGYRVVGFGFDTQAQARRPFMVELDKEGLLKWSKTLPTQVSAASGQPDHWNTSTVGWIEYTGIDKTIDPNNGNELFAVVGRVRGAGSIPTAFVQLYSEPANPGPVQNYIAASWTRDLTQTADFPEHTLAKPQICEDVAFRTVGSDLSVIWPVVGNQEGYSATGFVYKLAAGSGARLAGVDIGEIHAYDLRVGVVSMANGNIGVCSTKWPGGKSLGGEKYGWGDFPTAIRSCLEALRESIFPDFDTYWSIIDGVAGGGNIFNYYGSQSYVAELHGTDLSLVWEKQWQHKLDPDGGDDCYPGNARRRQCNFKIVEAEDGGLVVCGNTGHNFDDAYLAKLAPCEDVFAYTTSLPLDANGEHHITTNTEWTDDMNVAGSIVVDPGKTLTVNTATIGFAASTPQLKTNIVVQPGATLVVKNNGHLTSAPECTGQGMWDGVKVLGNGTVVGAGLAQLESGARISNALVALLCAETDVAQPSHINATNTGGIVQAIDARFTNNGTDVFMAEHGGFDPLVPGPSSFNHCQFLGLDALTGGVFYKPSVFLFGSQSITFTACTFRDAGTSTDHLERKRGPLVYNTTVRFEPGTNATDRTLFSGLFLPFTHMSFDPSRTYSVDAADFRGCSPGIHNVVTDLQRITNCTFEVPDGAAYGTSMYSSSGFEIEENTYTGSGDATSAPEVGAIYDDCGPEANLFYNNTFNGFLGSNEFGYSAGTVISGRNSSTDGENGLQIKCNDYGNTAANAFDVAFTKLPSEPALVTIGESQGLPGSLETPAGNTFSLSCAGNPAQHLHQNDDTEVNPFTYWHHTPQGAVQLVPECNDVAIALNDGQSAYDKPSACPTDLSGFVGVDDDLDDATDAEAEFEVLKEVYEGWRNGGDTEGLVDFVKDPLNDSYTVRNRLMLVAPNVDKEVWTEVFARGTTLNAWHVAQALLANSPLEPAVISMMERAELAPFYQDLVRNNQNGVSMHSIYKSELAHFYGTKAKAITGATSKVLLGHEPAAKAADILAGLDGLNMTSEPELRLGLHLATNNLAQARALVNTHRSAEPGNGYWKVQDMLVDHRERDLSVADLTSGEQILLESIAATDKEGAAEARVWLDLLGQPFVPEYVLPNTNKSRHVKANTETYLENSPYLRAYPNPSNGPVFVVYEVPEGVEQALLEVVSADGKLIFSQSIAPQNGIAELGKLPLGLNVATLRCDGIRVGIAKVSIVP